MRKKTAMSLLCVFFIITISGTIYSLGPTVAQSTPAFSVEPPSIVDETIEIGDTFRINLTITDVTNLGGFEFNLTYDTRVLTATEMTLRNGTTDFFPGAFSGMK